MRKVLAITAVVIASIPLLGCPPPLASAVLAQGEAPRRCYRLYTPDDAGGPGGVYTARRLYTPDSLNARLSDPAVDYVRVYLLNGGVVRAVAAALHGDSIAFATADSSASVGRHEVGRLVIRSGWAANQRELVLVSGYEIGACLNE